MAGIQSLNDLLPALMQPAALAELGVVLGCLGLAYGLVRLAHRNAPGSVWFGPRGIDGVLFPLMGLGLVLAARWAFMGQLPAAVFKLAVPILASLAIIRTTVRVLHVAFPESRLVRVLERPVSWLVWLNQKL